MKQYEASTELWNEIYKECKLEDITDAELKVEPMFDDCLKLFSMKAKRVLDYGCGTGDILFQCANFGNLDYGMGLDLSETGINYANKMAMINHYKQLDFIVGDITYLGQVEEESFDGIILSNVLDVVPKETSINIFHELTRVLKKDGLLFLKLNPFADKKQLEASGLTCIQDNLYEEDGVLRLREADSAYWKRKFSENYEIARYLEFPYPWQEGLNRLFLLRKK